MIEFSTNEPENNKQYTKMPGAYAIILNNDNLLAIIKTKTGYFLPGGGIENNELPEECLARECLEEIGAEILILDNFAIGNYFFHSTTINKDMESIGYFFICQIEKFLDIKTEDDHELVWLTKESAIELLYLNNQREAVRIIETKKYKSN